MDAKSKRCHFKFKGFTSISSEVFSPEIDRRNRISTLNQFSEVKPDHNPTNPLIEEAVLARFSLAPRISSLVLLRA